MLSHIIEKSKTIRDPENYYLGKELPERFELPYSILLYCHDGDFPHPSTSSRYMLILPFTDMLYRIDGEDYPLQYGMALLVSPFLIRCIPSLYNSYLRLIVSFDIRSEQSYLPRTPLMRMTNRAWKIVDSLIDDYQADRVLESAAGTASLLSELSANTIHAEQKKVSSKIAHCLYMINQNPSLSPTGKELAQKLGLSVSYLRAIFRKEMKISLGEYILQRKINAARQRLLNSDMNIEQIAKSCGYDSTYAFSHFFKRCMKLSPLRYRKAALSGILCGRNEV